VAAPVLVRADQFRLLRVDRELRMALGDPYQRPRRVAERRRLQKAAQAFQQRGIGRGSVGRPPPERRTFEPMRSGAGKSFKPRSIVLRAIPVARATALTPPYLAERASAAANNRRSGIPRGRGRRSFGDD
jgi:hypothetical protein